MYQTGEPVSDCYAVEGPSRTHLGIAIDLGILMKTPSGNPPQPRE
jgi:2-hydroxy-4-carboxymuconate semialdehyde hemiacetal dehydrogenase